MSRFLLPLLLGCWLVVSGLIWQAWSQSLQTFEQTSLHRMEQHTRSLVELQKTLVQLKLQEVERVLMALERLSLHPDMTAEQIRYAMQARKQPSPEVLALILLDKQGQIKAFSRENENPNLADRDYFVWHQQNPNTGQTFISPPQLSRSANPVPFIAMSRALHNTEGQFVGVLVAALDLEQLANELGKLVSDGSHATVLSDLNGQIFFRMPWVENSYQMQSGVVAAHQGEIKTLHSTRIISPFDNQSRQISYGRINKWPLVVFISENLTPTENEIKNFRLSETRRWGMAFVVISLLFLLLVKLLYSHDKKQLQLTTQAESLKRSNEELEQFAYVASHDLRQPLRMIKSYIELLEQRLKPSLNDETRQFMHFAADGARRMDQMLLSLLEYSRVGRMGEPMQVMPAAQLVDEALVYLQPIIKESDATITRQGEWPKLLISHNEGVRLFQNLISNALKYHAPEEAPKVLLEARLLDQQWLFIIEDQGIGIAPDQQSRLFKVFQRLHARTEYEGNGIGLAVCRKIVERHGGRIWVESEGAGKGSRFCFTLPAPLQDKIRP
ncbi:MAG: hypothetical protein IBX50_20115 [Marinospirillum sp.]|uniref:sensor histidine kinase n=1 Tax=Marinospirillum sp. TaxID=2183934 RepID=UPI0019DE8563|nr:ATP-binding protein [Marinospirillum sp.]MBE0508991.1 hypothetical protein [Marinospirillum sp.]